MAAVNAAYETLKALKEGMPTQRVPGVAPAALVKTLSRAADYERWTRDWLEG
jgi:carboxyvinyl-carboxyphosphonate phosphorylmutase